MSEQNAAKTLLSFVVHSVFIICAVLLLNKANNPIITASCICTVLLLAILNDRHNLNMVHLCVGLIAIKLLERLAFMFITTGIPDGEPAVWYNQLIYATHLLSDCLLFKFLYYRGRLSRFIQAKRNQPIEHVHTGLQEYLLMWVFVTFICIDAAALFENLLRNLEYVGISVATAEQFWDITFVYDNYSDWKRVLIGAEFMIIWLSVLFMSQIRKQSERLTV